MLGAAVNWHIIMKDIKTKKKQKKTEKKEKGNLTRYLILTRAQT